MTYTTIINVETGEVTQEPITDAKILASIEAGKQLTGDTPSVEDLQAQLAEIQSQLQALQK